MICTMSGTAIATGLAVICGYIGELSMPLRLAAFSFLAFLALFGFYHGIRHRKPLHIDIAGNGQLRLTEVHVGGTCRTENRLHVRGSAKVVRLVADSTIWPQLLLLRLRTDDGKIVTVPVLPDCVSPDSFRALSVACRWIAAHNDSAGRKDFY